MLFRFKKHSRSLLYIPLSILGLQWKQKRQCIPEYHILSVLLLKFIVLLGQDTSLLRLAMHGKVLAVVHEQIIARAELINLWFLPMNGEEVLKDGKRAGDTYCLEDECLTTHQSLC